MTSETEESLKHKSKRLKRLLEELNGKTVVVEGKKDRNALENSGITGRIEILNASPENVAERLQGVEEVVVLTDFDRRGKQLASLLEEHLHAHRATPNMEARRAFRYVLGITYFENLCKKLEEFHLECKKKGVKVI